MPRVTGLSEQAKMTFLQEKIQNAKNNSWIGISLSIIGIILMLVGAYLTFFPKLSVSIEEIGMVVFLGVIVMLAGGAMYSFYENKRIKLVKELGAMAIKNPTCPKCEKHYHKVTIPSVLSVELNSRDNKAQSISQDGNLKSAHQQKTN